MNTRPDESGSRAYLRERAEALRADARRIDRLRLHLLTGRSADPITVGSALEATLIAAASALDSLAGSFDRSADVSAQLAGRLPTPPAERHR